MNRKRVTSPAVDVFAFGRLLYLVMTSCEPLETLDRQDIIQLAMKGRVPALAWPGDCRLGAQSAVTAGRCLEFHAADRPDMKTVYAEILAWEPLHGEEQDRQACP